MNNKLKDFFKNIFRNRVFLNIFPVTFFYLILLPLYFIKNNNEFIVTLINIELVVIFLVNPLYLFVINMIHSIKYHNKIFIKNIALMMLSCIIGFSFEIFYDVTFHSKIRQYHSVEPPELWLIYFMVLMLFAIIIIGIIEQVILLIIYKFRLKKER